MNRAEGGQSRGYTIVETLIFLAVSGAMFISAMTLISGRQARSEFSTSVRNFEAVLNDVASDVSNGYYANASSVGERLKCQIYGTGPNAFIDIVTDGAADNQGANKGCIFIGKTIQLGIAGSNDEKYGVFGIAGLQYKNNVFEEGVTDSIDTSHIRPLARTEEDDDFIPDSVQSALIGSGTKVGCVFYSSAAISPVNPSPCKTTGVMKTDVITFMTRFQPAGYTFKPGTGFSGDVDVLMPKDTVTTLGRDPRSAASTVSYFTTDNVLTNPVSGIYICLQSTGSKQYAILKIGGTSSRFSVSSTIADGSCT